MAEQEEKHRHELERMMVSSDIKSRNRGQALGFAIAAITLLGGIWLVYSGKDWVGLVAILTPLVGLVAVFVYNQNRQDAGGESPASQSSNAAISSRDQM